MAKIRITPETLEAQAKQLGSLNDQHRQIYQQIQSLVNDLSAEWEGEANKAFVESFRGQDAALKKFSEDIESFKRRMETAANDMRAAEEQVRSRMAQM